MPHILCFNFVLVYSIKPSLELIILLGQSRSSSHFISSDTLCYLLSFSDSSYLFIKLLDVVPQDNESLFLVNYFPL